MEKKSPLLKYQMGVSNASSSNGRSASARSTKHMTATMISRLIQEFRQLQIEVTELKAAKKPVEKVDD